MAWRVTQVVWVDPPPERDIAEGRYTAAVVHLEADGRKATSRLELSDTAAATGMGFDPEEAIGPFLEWSEIPELLIVDSEGVARPA